MEKSFEEIVWDCIDRAAAVRSFAEARDKGAPQEYFEDIVAQTFENAEKRQVVFGLLKFAYAHPTLTPILAWDTYYRRCLNDPGFRNPTDVEA